MDFCKESRFYGILSVHDNNSLMGTVVEMSAVDDLKPERYNSANNSVQLKVVHGLHDITPTEILN